MSKIITLLTFAMILGALSVSTLSTHFIVSNDYVESTESSNSGEHEDVSEEYDDEPVIAHFLIPLKKIHSTFCPVFFSTFLYYAKPILSFIWRPPIVVNT